MPQCTRGAQRPISGHLSFLLYVGSVRTPISHGKSSPNLLSRLSQRLYFFFFQLVLFDQPGMISVLEAGESSEMTPRGKGAGDHKDLNLMPRQMD